MKMALTEQIPTLDVTKVLDGGIMQSLGEAIAQGNISLTFPPPGVIIGRHIYIPVLPPLPILPVFIVP